MRVDTQDTDPAYCYDLLPGGRRWKRWVRHCLVHMAGCTDAHCADATVISSLVRAGVRYGVRIPRSFRRRYES